MSKNKRPSAADLVYAQHHMYGSSFRTNPINNRVAVMERMYFRLLGELATNRFKWTGLPSTIDERFLEMTLFHTALSVFYYDLRFDKFLALRGGGTNWNNMYDNPVGFSVVGNNFVGMNVSALRDGDSARMAIPIWANKFRTPDLDIVTIYAKKFADLDRTIEINAHNARLSKVLVANNNQRLSIENIDRQYDEGQNSIMVDGALQDMAFIQNFDLGVNPDSIEKLHILKVRLWNECMGLLGIENANQDKKERLVADEVNANDGQTAQMRFVNLEERQAACERINKYYGLEMWVEFNTEIEKKRDAVFAAAVAQMAEPTSDDIESERV